MCFQCIKEETVVGFCKERFSRDFPWNKSTETLKKMAHHISYHDHDISMFKIETVLCIINLFDAKSSRS